MSEVDIIANIKALDIGEPLSKLKYGETPAQYMAKLKASANATGDGYVDNGSLFNALDGMPLQQQNDAMYWFLLGQLAANKKVDRVGNPRGWYKELTNILNSIGMVMAEVGLTEVSGAQKGSGVQDTVENMLKNQLSQPEISFLKETMEAMQKSQNERPNGIFSRSSTDRKMATFQTGTATVDSSLNIKITLGAFAFTAHNEFASVFGIKYSSTGTVDFIAGHGPVILSKQNADKYRKTVEDKLYGHIEDNIADLDI